MIISLEALAHIHALSYVYATKYQINWQKECPGIFATLVQDEELETDAVSNFELFKKDLVKSKASKDLIEGVNSLAVNYKKFFAKFTSFQDSKFLVHGDYWSNNVMFGTNKCKFHSEIAKGSFKYY